ncbi:MAG: ComEC/Rec2 family competence protein, partial [Calditrichota bacterium]
MFRMPLPAPAAPIVIAFSCGIILSRWFQYDIVLQSFLLFLISTFVAVCCRKFIPHREVMFTILLLLSCTFAGSTRFSLWQYQMFSPLQSIESSFSCDSILVEIISIRHGKRLRAVAETKRIWATGKSVCVTQKVQLYFHVDMQSVLPGSQLLLKEVELKIPQQVRNPGGFDYRYWLKMRGIAFIADVQRNKVVNYPSGHLSGRYALAWLRDNLAQRVDRLFQTREASLLKALWLGQGKQLDADIRSDFQRTGLVHVLAVSGLHVGFLLAMMVMLTSFMRLGKRIKATACCFGLIAFLCITGFQSAVTRAVIMGIVWMICRGLERNTHPQQVLFMAALCILICWPQQLFWLGFQLSFSAVFWINFLYSKFRIWGEKLV